MKETKLAANFANLAAMVSQYKQYLDKTLAEKRQGVTTDSANSVEEIIARLEKIHGELNSCVDNTSSQQPSEELLQAYVKDLTTMRNKATNILHVAALAFPGIFNSKFSNAFELVSHIRRNSKLVKVRAIFEVVYN